MQLERCKMKSYEFKREGKAEKIHTLSSAISCSRFANVTMKAASFFFAFSNW